jgi:repressor LexA
LETFGDKLKSLRMGRKLSLDGMVDQLKEKYETNISKSMLSRYENNKADVTLDNVRMLTDFFNVPDDYFVKDNIVHEEQTPYEEESPLVNLPIVGRISCGNGIIAIEDVEGYEPAPKSWLNGGTYFYLRAKGNSMTGARINDGDLLLIRQQEDVEDGEIAAVYVDGEAKLKRVFKRDGSLILQSENTNYPPQIIKSGDVKIIGKLEKSVIAF